jgi:hypothetical protein
VFADAGFRDRGDQRYALEREEDLARVDTAIYDIAVAG